MAAILKKSAAILDFQVAHRADLTSSPQRTFVPNLVLVSQFARLVPLSALLSVILGSRRFRIGTQPHYSALVPSPIIPHWYRAPLFRTGSQPHYSVQIHTSAIARCHCRGGRQTVWLCCFSIPSRRTVGNQSIQALDSLCSIQARERHLTDRYIVTAWYLLQNTSVICLKVVDCLSSAEELQWCG